MQGTIVLLSRMRARPHESHHEHCLSVSRRTKGSLPPPGYLTMAKEHVSMPSGGAGLTRYFEDYKSKIELTPWTVVGACGAVAIMVIALHIFLST